MKITSWEQIIGHRSTIKFIQQALATDTVQDVILFWGDSGIGKSSIAKLLACELVSVGDAEYKKKQLQSVCIDNMSTESIKLFNMSSIKEKEDEISKIKEELTLGFAYRGRKVIICDEAHGMSKMAQDAILTELENLDRGVYVIFCTTEVGSLREALVGRCRTRFPLRMLNNMEINRLIMSEIENRGLRFVMPTQVVATMISFYANNQPRVALNLLGNFQEGSLVSNESISTFMNINNALIIIKLVEYLYGSMILGLDYISTLEMDTVFADMLIEVTKVAMGGKSKALSQKDEGMLNTVIKGKDINNLICFTIDVTSSSRMTRKSITAAFMKNHASMREAPKRDTEGVQYYRDLVTIESVEREEGHNVSLTKEESQTAAQSFAELLSNADIVI